LSDMRTMGFYSRIRLRHLRRLYLLLVTVGLLLVMLYSYKVYKIFSRRCFLDTHEYPTTQHKYIPKSIYQTASARDTWIISAALRSWKRLNPDYYYKLFNDEEARGFVKENMAPEIYDTYMKMPIPILKADFFRYIIIYVKGGIYTDIDTLCRRAIDTWTDGIPDIGIIIGVESDEEEDNEEWRKYFIRHFQLLQWTIAAKPRHPMLEKVIMKIHEISQQKTNKTISKDDILNWTGPGMWTDTILEYIKDTHGVDYKEFKNLRHGKRVDDIYILPRSGFSAPSGPEDGGEYNPEAKVEHLFWGSWKNKGFFGRLITPLERYVSLLFRC